MKLLKYEKVAGGWDCLIEFPIKDENKAFKKLQKFIPDMVFEPGFFDGETKNAGEFSLDGIRHIPIPKFKQDDNNSLMRRYKTNPNFIPEKSARAKVNIGKPIGVFFKREEHSFKFPIKYVWTKGEWVPELIYLEKDLEVCCNKIAAEIIQHEQVKREIREAKKEDIFKVLEKHTIKCEPVKVKKAATVREIHVAERASTSRAFDLQQGRGSTYHRTQKAINRIIQKFHTGELNPTQVAAAKSQGWI